MSKRISRYFAAMSLVATFSLCGSAVLAASHCKGMSEQACSGDTNGSWVQGYTRKDGKQVSGHCRLKPAQRTSKAQSVGEPKLSRSE